MIFDGKIFKINGASDLEDSSMFNGLIALFELDTRVDLINFIVPGSRPLSFKTPPKYVRHPYGAVYDLSRDQYICLSAGYKSQNMPEFVNEQFITGKDILSPSVKGHTLRCQGRTSTWLQNAWLWLDVVFHAKIQPTSEPNQLIAMMMCADRKYLRWWCANNKQWQRSIRRYWYTEDGHWRNEPELAEQMIKRIQAEIA